MNIEGVLDMPMYEIIFDMYKEISEGFHEQDAVDNLIDDLESRGYLGGCLRTVEDVETDNIPEDMYVIGGNHCLVLLHNGNFCIKEIIQKKH